MKLPINSPTTYNGNPYLLRGKIKRIFTQKEIDEFRKCIDDPIYFARNYIKIVNVDKGVMLFQMWDFQEKLLQTMYDNRFVIVKYPRQQGKTTTVISYLLHYVLFNSNVSVAILANKADTAREILARLKFAYELLPDFVKQGVMTWNKGNIEFANGSKILATSTAKSSVRGQTFNIVFLDEFAHVEANIAEEFFASTFPTISSGKTTKLIIVSTPKGLNKFYDMWMDAIEGKSTYVPVEVHWSEMPGRDEAWKQQTIKNSSEEQFRAEFECEFIGSTNTLIHPAILRAMRAVNPVYHEHDFDVYEHVETGHTYVIVVDPAKGQNKDYSAMSVVDVTEIPYKQVAKYRNNSIPYIAFPAVVFNVARKYNDAFVLVEINDIGQTIADTLHFELGYENLIKVETRGKQGQIITGGFKRKLIQYGVKTSTAVKRIGCANLKNLVESHKLQIIDSHTIMELRTFSEHKESFAAEEGKNDDLAMTLVLFGWLSSQKYFRESLKNDIRKNIQEEQLKLLDEDLVPWGVYSNGLEETTFVDDEGTKWVEDLKSYYPMNDLGHGFGGKF